MLILIVFVGFHKEQRVSFYRVVEAFKQRVILRVLGLAITWVFFCVLSFYVIGIWGFSNFKTTVVWIVTYAFVTLFEVSKIKDSKYYFKSKVKETIGLSTLLTFILELHSFSLIIELIMIPIILVFGIMVIVGNKENKNNSIVMLIKIILVIITAFYFFNSLFISLVSLKDTFSWKNLTEFITPILLSFSFMPFIYLLYLYQGYETKLIVLRTRFDDDLFHYAKRLAFFSFRCDLDGLNRWVRVILMNDVREKEGLKKCVEDVKLRKVIESKPVVVAFKNGWSPFLAKDFLISEGANTKDYHFDYDTWFSCSDMIEIGNEEVFKDNFMYCIYGDENKANILKLKFNINNPPMSEKSKTTIYKLTEVLISKALMNNSIDITEFFEDIPTSIETNDHLIQINKDDFISKNDGYTLEIKIFVRNCAVQDHNGLTQE
ncbi:hypothetical protein C9426_34755 [Serratia sp. S1B]|nr:hypothetical protein C9426_34755 [Serratia sp. S1B]